MKLIWVWVGLIFVLYLIYVGYAVPFLNEGKAAELWGNQNKWVWYAQFCFFHFMYALIPMTIGAALIFLVRKFPI